MKKLLVVLLALSLIFAFAACGETAEETAAEEAEVFTSIALGEVCEMSLADEYVLIETPEALLDDDTDCEITCYYCENGDVPYIFVYRWENTEGLTLEEETAIDATLDGDGYYQMCDGDEYFNGVPYSTYFYGDEGSDGQYYYVESDTMVDGDYFVSVDWAQATEEVQLGESGEYIWIPVGYEAYESTEEDIAHGEILYAAYDEDYYMPLIYIMKDTHNYADKAWLWAYDFPEGLAFDEATYNSWEEAGWDDASAKAYYSALGVTIDAHEIEEVNGITVDMYYGIFVNADGVQKTITDSYFTIGDTDYNIWFSSPLEPAPCYASALFNSLHTK